EEQHGNEGEAHGPAVLGALQLGDAALVRARLRVIRAARRERARDEDDDDDNRRREAEINEETGAVSHWRNLEPGSSSGTPRVPRAERPESLRATPRGGLAWRTPLA